MDHRTNIKTEANIAPNLWKWVLIILCAVVVLALMATGIFYYFRGRKENRPPPGIPQSTVWHERSELSVELSGVAEALATIDHLLPS